MTFKTKIEESPKTLRDEFAINALSGLLASGHGTTWENYAIASYKIADRMLAEREKHE